MKTVNVSGPLRWFAVKGFRSSRVRCSGVHGAENGCWLDFGIPRKSSNQLPGTKTITSWWSKEGRRSADEWIGRGGEVPGTWLCTAKRRVPSTHPKGPPEQQVLDLTCQLQGSASVYKYKV